MNFKNYVEKHLTKISISKNSYNCILDGDEIDFGKLEEEEPFDIIGINSLYFLCELCQEELDDEDLVKDHWKENHEKK